MARRMFSSRLHWDLRPNQLAQVLSGLRRQRIEILDLTESNPTRAGFSYPEDLILGAFRDPRSLVYDPAPAGMRRAREVVAAYYSARGFVIDPANIFLSTSTSESYGWLFKLLADAGDEVLVPRPSYPLFEYLAQMELVRVGQYPLVYNGGWAIDVDALTRAITSRTRAIVLVNPNNPTGSFVKRGELERIVELCATRELALVSDEVFADYRFGPDPERVSSLAGIDQVLTFSLSGLSKIAGLPQMKLGWIVLGGPPALRSEALERLELIADTYLSVGTPVQHALARLIEAGDAMRQQISARVAASLGALRDRLDESSGARVLQVEGGWYATLRVPRTKSEEQWCLDLLQQDHVLVQPGFFYDFETEAYLVLSLLTPPDVFHEGTRRLMARL